jgi:hypothetical protein
VSGHRKCAHGQSPGRRFCCALAPKPTPAPARIGTS